MLVIFDHSMGPISVGSIGRRELTNLFLALWLNIYSHHIVKVQREAYGVLIDPRCHHLFPAYWRQHHLLVSCVLQCLFFKSRLMLPYSTWLQHDLQFYMSLHILFVLKWEAWAAFRAHSDFKFGTKPQLARKKQYCTEYAFNISKSTQFSYHHLQELLLAWDKLCISKTKPPKKGAFVI